MTSSRAVNKSIDSHATKMEGLNEVIRHLEEAIGIMLSTKLFVMKREEMVKSDKIGEVFRPRNVLGDRLDRISRINCKKCNHVSKNRKQFKEHMKYSHGQELKCIICDRIFEKSYNLEEHMKEHKTKKDFNCQLCGSEFFLYCRFKKHMNGHLDPKQKFCHFFNNQKECLFEEFGCKFKHEPSKMCVSGKNCLRHLCQYRHEEKPTDNEDRTNDNEEEANDNQEEMYDNGEERNYNEEIPNDIKKDPNNNEEETKENKEESTDIDEKSIDFGERISVIKEDSINMENESGDIEEEYHNHEESFNINDGSVDIDDEAVDNEEETIDRKEDKETENSLFKPEEYSGSLETNLLADKLSFYTSTPKKTNNYECANCQSDPDCLKRHIEIHHKEWTNGIDDPASPQMAT